MNDQTPVTSELTPDFLTSPTSGASPAQSPYSNRAFWGAYKGLSRGLWGGIMVGSVLGACVGGLATLLALPVLGLNGLAAIGIIGGFSFAGMLYYAEKFSIAGAAAGAVSTALEIYEERKAEDAFAKGEKLSLSQRQLLERKHEYGKGPLKNDYTPENNPSDERFQPYYWKVGLAGAALGAAVGLLVNTFGDGMETMTHGAISSAEPGTALGEHTPPADGTFMQRVQEALHDIPKKLWLMVAGGAAAGSTFGINRYYLRQPFYLANALFEGDLQQFTKQREHERELTRQYSKTGRIEPNLEELAPSAYKREPSTAVSRPYARNYISVPAPANTNQPMPANQNEPVRRPGKVVREATWGFELNAMPGPHGEQDASVTYKATASKEGERLFEKTFHGSWADFQKEMKKELDASTEQGRQA